MKKLSLVLASASLIVLVSCGGSGTTLEPTEAAKVSALSGSVMSSAITGGTSSVNINTREDLTGTCETGTAYIDAGMDNCDYGSDLTSASCTFKQGFDACSETVLVCSTTKEVVLDGELTDKFDVTVSGSSYSAVYTIKGVITFSGSAITYLDVKDGGKSLTEVDCEFDLNFTFTAIGESDLENATFSGSICGATLNAEGELETDGTVLDEDAYCPNL